MSNLLWYAFFIKKEVIQMDYEIVFLEEKTIVGFCKRTANDKSDMEQVIGSLWQQWAKAEKEVKERSNDKCIGLYSNYIGMEYDTTVGCEIKKGQAVPSNMIQKTIPKGKYAKFVLIGDVVKTVQKAWQEIWKMDLQRTFTADFEEYQQGENMEEMEIHIYVAIK